jgi:hypothetical protein
MSTDHLPEVKGDKSGDVQTQSGQSSEWPKKIRQLTAGELDRLTIDNKGRFYWDGKLISRKMPPSNPPREQKPLISEDAAFELLEQAALELGDRKAALESTETIEPAAPAESHPPPGGMMLMNLDVVVPTSQVAPVASRSEVSAPSDGHPTLIAPTTPTIEWVRLKLSIWQSIALLMMTLGIVIGASGVAANGFVVAYNWGCQVGLINRFCPPAPELPAAPSSSSRALRQ